MRELRVRTKPQSSIAAHTSGPLRLALLDGFHAVAPGHWPLSRDFPSDVLWIRVRVCGASHAPTSKAAINMLWSPRSPSLTCSPPPRSTPSRTSPPKCAALCSTAPTASSWALSNGAGVWRRVDITEHSFDSVCCTVKQVMSRAKSPGWVLLATRITVIWRAHTRNCASVNALTVTQHGAPLLWRQVLTHQRGASCTATRGLSERTLPATGDRRWREW